MNLDLRLYKELEQEFGEMLERHAAEIVTGKATDWADYKYRTGYLKALRDALEVAREANKRVIGVDTERWAMPSTLMDHAIDPRKEILDKVGDLQGVDVFGSDVLVAIYRRPEKTKSGIILADSTREEDKYQGKVFLILKMGPLAFVDEDGNRFRDIKEGDWVVARTSDGWAVTLNSSQGFTTRESAIDCRIITDINIRLRVLSPDLIYW